MTKDADFGELSTLRGFPPKVIWLRLGNCTTAQIEGLLRLHFESVRQLTESDDIDILSLLLTTVHIFRVYISGYLVTFICSRAGTGQPSLRQCSSQRKPS